MNVSQLLTKSARTFPQNLALVHGPKRLTYAHFNTKNNYAKVLKRALRAKYWKDKERKV